MITNSDMSEDRVSVSPGIRMHGTVSPRPHVRFATRILFAIALPWLFTAPANARMYCHQDFGQAAGTGGGKLQINGFTIEVSPAEKHSCHSSVISPTGQIVFSADDWGAEIDPITGKDINGDGEPDAVLVSFSGGMHCCWTVHIISLGQRPGLIREFENSAGASFADLKGDGRIQVRMGDVTFDGAFGLNHVYSAIPLLIVQLQGNEFRDVGPDFWPVYEKEIGEERGRVSKRQLEGFKAADEEAEFEAHQKTKSAILGIVMANLYGGRPKKAENLLKKWWPAESEPEIWKEIMKGYCTGLRAELGVAKPPLCNQ